MHPDRPAHADTELQAIEAGTQDGTLLEPGARIGAYVIRRLLGEGGMGHVYLAEQSRPLRRTVAVKLIREQVASPLARAYFDVERQALAQMQHPAIAQVFDAGTTADGHPYLAMEVVEGRPLTQFCSDAGLSLDQRLALFVRICHGVQHAHQKGIIHRDLKPANVLVRDVDGQPMPKIIDFGIAIGGDAGADIAVDSATADRGGTAVYMSPGTGRPPPPQPGYAQRRLFTRRDAVRGAHRGRRGGAQFVRAPVRACAAAPYPARRGGPPGRPKPATAPASGEMLQAARRLPAELRAVLCKALATEREDRYDSAAALAEDLQRFRENRPLTALPHTRLYLARTFAARHRLGMAAAILVAAALVTGGALALNGLARARQSAELAQIAAAKATHIADFVRSILAGVDPDRAKSMDRQLMRLVLDSAAERAGREISQPQVRSAIEHTIADSYASLGERALAGAHYEAAIAAGIAAALEPPAMAELVMRQAENMNAAGRPKEGLTAAHAAVAMLAALPETDRNRLNVESRLGSIECDAGLLQVGRARLQRTLALQRGRFGDDDADTLDSMLGLATVASDIARYDEARPLFEMLIKRYRTRYGAENSRTLKATNGLAVVLLEQEDFAGAEKLLAPMLAVHERIFGPEHPMTALVLNNLGGAIRQQGRNEEARPYYQRSLALSQKLYGPDNKRTVAAEINLALLLRDAGELAQADQHAHSAVAHAAVAFGDNPYQGIIQRELATILIRQKRYAEAERQLDRAWSLLADAKAYGPGHPRSQDVVETCIELYTQWHKPQLAALWRARQQAPAAAAGAD